MHPQVAEQTDPGEKTPTKCKENVGGIQGVCPGGPDLSFLTFLLGLMEELLFSCVGSCSNHAAPGGAIGNERLSGSHADAEILDSDLLNVLKAQFCPPIFAFHGKVH